MARVHGDVGPLTIGAIFVVVLSSMYVGVQYTRGRLVEHEQPSPRERTARAAAWTAINQLRTARGLRPITDRQRQLVLPVDVPSGSGGANGSGTGGDGAQDRSTAGVVEPDVPLCRRLVVHVPAAGAGLGDRLADRLAAADRDGLLFWRNVYEADLGVTIRNETASAVFRTCRHRRFSP